MIGAVTLRRLARCDQGATELEYAFAIPILATLMTGIIQFGMVLHASGAMRHALGEGIRHAKVHPTATQSEVNAVVRDAMAGVDATGIQTLNFQRGTQNGAEFGRITMTYALEPMVPLLPINTITLNETKMAYLPQ